MTSPHPARESKRAQRERDFGGSLQCVMLRFELLDDAIHPAGSVLYSTDVVRTTYGRRSDGSLGMRWAFCRPVPEHLQFVMGGEVHRDDEGCAVGWTCPPKLSPARLAVDAWSANVYDGAVQGYYRWSAPECVPTLFAGANLDGDNFTSFRAATTVALKAGFHLTAEPELPEFTTGITVPDAAA